MDGTENKKQGSEEFPLCRMIPSELQQVKKQKAQFSTERRKSHVGFSQGATLRVCVCVCVFTYRADCVHSAVPVCAGTMWYICAEITGNFPGGKNVWSMFFCVCVCMCVIKL